MNDMRTNQADVVEVVNGTGRSDVVLVCEHAAASIPEMFGALGLAAGDRESHAVWDPGALGVARAMAKRLDARLVAGRVSRLVHDCNRPSGAVEAMPAMVDGIDVPGNADVSPEERTRRAEDYHVPFHDALAAALNGIAQPVLVTMHSFTPVFAGQRRSVEIGLLHDEDSRLVDAMLAHSPGAAQGRDIRRNAPYGPEDGVTYTLRHHALPGGHPNVMIELRSDLIETPAEQRAMARLLADWIEIARPEVMS